MESKAIVGECYSEFNIGFADNSTLNIQNSTLPKALIHDIIYG